MGERTHRRHRLRLLRSVILLPELWRGGYRATHFRRQTEKGDNMPDYEQVTQDIREGLSRIAANKGDKSVENIMKEILAVFAVACEQNSIDKEEFLQAFFEWYAEKRS